MADDDALMDRFEQNSKRFNARDAIITVFVCAVVLVILNGNSMKHAGERLKPGVQRSVVLGVGKPAGWIADQLPLHTVAHDLTAGLSPDAELSKTGGFDEAPAAAGAANQVPLVTPDAFDPASIGAKPAPKRPLKKLLVTGDSLSQPLDEVMARDLASNGVKVKRDPHLGTGISKTAIVDWGKLAVTQKEAEKPDAVIMFIGANEGFPMKNAAKKDVSCCGVEWASIYANRVRKMMNVYRAGGTRVIWVKLPAQRAKARQDLARVVDAAIDVAAQPYRSQVSVYDTNPTFTPGFKYRDSMSVNGKDTIVRREDGIHLNDAGAELLGSLLVKQLQLYFTF